jgi:hypothetical protein
MMSKVSLNTPAPDFELIDLHGQSFRLSDFHGQKHISLVWSFVGLTVSQVKFALVVFTALLTSVFY